MSTPDLSSILDECITQLQNGATLEQVLASYPRYASELKALLETADGLHAARSQVKILGNAQSRSRMAFINGAYQPVRNHGLFHAFHLRFATAFITILILLCFGVLGTTLASAHALPGDTFYPVKLAFEQVQLNLAAGSAQRLELQQNFEERRAAEVSELKQAGRSSPVSFAGELIRSGDQWQVAGITLDLTSQQQAEADSLLNSIVVVSGDLEGMTVHVSDLHLQVLTFNGIIQQIHSNSWVVDGVEISLDSNTEIAGTAVVGNSVQITARRNQNGQILALTVDITASSFVHETGDPATEVHEETLTPSATNGNESHDGSEGQVNPPGGQPSPDSTNTPQNTSTQNSDGEGRQPTATQGSNLTPTATRSDQHGGDGEGPTRTVGSPQNPTPTATWTPTPTLTPTPTNRDSDSGDHYRSSRTPTPTQQNP